MFIIVGLGNPDAKYRKNFHNLGYTAVGDVADMLGTKFKKIQCEAKTCQVSKNFRDILIARPLTYMNNSGRAVKQLLTKFRCTPDDLIVIYDDIDIPKGTIRIRKSGTAGTHNGMRSVVSEIGTSDFLRIRIGIKDPDNNLPILDYVLSDVSEKDYEVYISSCRRAAEAAISIASGESVDLVMQNYNGKNPFDKIDRDVKSGDDGDGIGHIT